jgi:hypothetical protein
VFGCLVVWATALYGSQLPFGVAFSLSYGGHWPFGEGQSRRSKILLPKIFFEDDQELKWCLSLVKAAKTR